MQWNVLHTKKITRKPSSRLWETLNLVLCGMVRREVALPGFPVQFWPWVSVCVKFQIFSLFLPGFPRSSVVSYHHPKSINVGRLSVSKLSLYVTACAWCPWMDFSLSLPHVARIGSRSIATPSRIKWFQKRKEWIFHQDPSKGTKPQSRMLGKGQNCKTTQTTKAQKYSMTSLHKVSVFKWWYIMRFL